MTFSPVLSARKGNGEPLVWCRACGNVDEKLEIDNKVGEVRCGVCGKRTPINPEAPPKRAPKRKKP